ncbi:hypothetical protein ACFQ1M_10260 [Sungkyunkwania multivorans]|uniref:YcxB-like protein domain-containing protein n=1 Tax=Sungkyunkwania multivorans TaxID=1173618 RepID=A0ABW3CYI9_9FLAO
MTDKLHEIEFRLSYQESHFKEVFEDVYDLKRRKRRKADAKIIVFIFLVPIIVGFIYGPKSTSEWFFIFFLCLGLLMATLDFKSHSESLKKSRKWIEDFYQLNHSYKEHKLKLNNKSVCLIQDKDVLEVNWENIAEHQVAADYIVIHYQHSGKIVLPRNSFVNNDFEDFLATFKRRIFWPYELKKRT